MRTAEALRLAGRDLFYNSWRLVPVNAALGLILAAGIAATVATPLAAPALLLGGPLAAALVHCSVLLTRNENLAFHDAVEGLRLYWRRGIELAAAGLGVAIVGGMAVRMYFTKPSLLPLGFLVLYLLGLAAMYGLIVWTLAIAEPGRTVRASARHAAVLVARRPGGTLALGVSLLLVNALGIAAGVMPFLTVTIAYSFLAVAYFSLAETEAHA